MTKDRGSNIRVSGFTISLCANRVPANNCWFLEGTSIYFEALAPFASAGFVAGLKVVLANRATRYAYNTIINDYERIKYLLTFLGSRGARNIEELSEEHLIGWRTALAGVGREYQIGAVRGVLIDSTVYLNAPLVDKAAVNYLQDQEFPGNPKGDRVNDSDQGRLTLAERHVFETKARQAFESGRIAASEGLRLGQFSCGVIALAWHSQSALFREKWQSA